MVPSLQGVSFTSSSQIMRYQERYFAPKLFVVSEADLDILILCVYLVKMALALALTACSDSLLWLLAAILFWYLLCISLFSDMSPSQAFLYFGFSHLFHPTDCGDSIEITTSQLNISMSVSLYRPNYYLFICLVWFLFEEIPSPVTSGRWNLHVGRRLSLENCLHIDEKMRMWENCRWEDGWCDKHRIFHTYRKMLIQPSNLHLI